MVEHLWILITVRLSRAYNCITYIFHEANLPALTSNSCQALYVLCSRTKHYKKEPLLLALILDQTLACVKGHVSKLNLAIVQVFKLTQPLCGYYQTIYKPWCCAGNNILTSPASLESKQHPAYLQEIHN